ncbi:tail assembly protein [Paraburkholderia silviterrae]|uniref:Tail assembly protein n=1 Tax=Paraburkholderia silviterrae TaxID=2528715 RepID=A0A4R5ME25_9BURK|nr:tail assembly protein [Paraburkholderia silviterrae]TDG25370.1 tail assembly protein [Paraburkholderia silviterrae]
MNDQLRTIRLYGVLGARFGRVHRLAVRSTSEAMRALGVVLPGFRQFMARSREQGLTFAVFVGKQNLARDELEYPVGPEEIRVAPVLVGSKRGGLFQTILGAALVVVGVFTQMPTLIGLGASMALGGVVQMLSPQTGGLAGVANNGTSYYFNGPVNSAAQGEPVPIVYGRMVVGSKVISSGIYAQDQN